MKKIISFIALFAILFSTVGNTAFALVKYNQTPNVTKTVVSTGITQITLNQVLTKKGFTNKGLTYLLQIKGVTTTELAGLKNASQKAKSAILNKLVKGGLTGSQVNYLKLHKGLTSAGLTIIGVIGSSNVSTGVNTYFLQKRPTLGDKVYQINFKSITANGGNNSYKAGEVLANFTKKIDFPTKLVLPKGFSYDLKTDDLDGDFVKTNALKNKISNISDDIGTITVSDPELRILPDRIQYVKKTKLSFTTDEQLSNIKSNLSAEFNLSEKSLQDIKTQLNGVSLQTVNPQVVGNMSTQNVSVYNNSSYNHNKTIQESKIRNVTLANVNSGLSSELFSKYKDKNANTLKANAFNSISNLTNDEITEKVRLECLKENTSSECNSISSNNMIKELETEEVINIGLIPASNKDGKLLIESDPSSLRISQNNILSRFEVLKEIEKTKTGDDYDNINEQTGNEQVPVFDDKVKYCAETYPRATETELQKCEDAVDYMKSTTPKKYSKDLLNGFTIGENKAYSFGTTLNVDLLFTTIKVFEIEITFSYGYAFGVRIPIRAQSVISDSQLQNYTNPETNKQESEYTTALKIDTLDGDIDYYKNVLDDDSKVYGGKEFVFEFTANINIYIWIVGMDDGVSVDIPLVSTLIVALAAAAELGGGGIEDVANTFGLGKANIMKVFVAFITDALLSDTADEFDIDRSDLDTWLNATNTVLKGLDKGGEFLAGDKYLSAWTKVYLYLNNHNNPLHLQSAMEWSVNQQNLYKDYKDALKTVTSNWGKVVSKAGEIKSLNIVARVLQNAMIAQFVANNKIDLGMNFKAPYGDEEIPLYTLVSPEIPFYNDGLFKLVGKIGVDSSLGGRITANCDEINSDGACPNIFYQTEDHGNTYDFDLDPSLDMDGVQSFIDFKKDVDNWISNVLNDHTDNSSSFIIGTDDSRLHFDRNDGFYVGRGFATDASEFKTDDLGRYSQFGIKLNDFRYHPILIFTLFAKAGAGLKIPYIGWYTYWTPKIDLYTFKFSSDSIYLSQHEGTDGELDMTTYDEDGKLLENKVYTTTPPDLNNISEIFTKDIDFSEKITQIYGVDIKNTSWDKSSNLIIYSEGVTGSVDNKSLDDDINNKFGNHIYYTYNSSYGNSSVSEPEEPACAEEGTTKLYTSYEDKIWPNFKTDFQNVKNFKIKAIACNSLFKIKSDIKNKSDIFFDHTSLVNKYQQPFIRENKEHQGNIVDLLSFDIDEFDKGYYLKINKADGKEGIGRWHYQGNDFIETEYIKYLITDNKDEELTCINGNHYSGEKIVLQNPGNNEIGIFDNSINLTSNRFGIGESRTNLKIVKCAVRNDGSIFQSYVKTYPVSTYSSSANDSFVDKAADVGSVKEIVDDFGKGGVGVGEFAGFGKLGGSFNPKGDFMNRLNLLIGKDGISSEIISTMNTMMLNGDMGGDGMGALAGMKDMSNGKIVSGFKTMLNGGQISKKGLNSISKMLNDKKVTFNGLTKLASLYKEFGINYVGGKIIQGGLKQVDKGLIPIKEHKKLVSKDEYVNEKLDEINNCFKSTYEFQLKNIEDTISNFKQTRDRSGNKKTKAKYQKAIDKLEEIKSLFINRYENIIKYEGNNVPPLHDN